MINLKAIKKRFGLSIMHQEIFQKSHKLSRANTIRFSARKTLWECLSTQNNANIVRG